jgi:hypothetical protein
MFSAAMTAVPFVFSIRNKLRKGIDDVNKKCEEMGLPPAFEINGIENAERFDDIYLWGNTDFRFEGFGIDLSERRILMPIPRISFHVHYKKDTREHRDLGKFFLESGFFEELTINLLSFGKVKQVVQDVGRAGEVVESLIEVVGNVGEAVDEATD